MFLFLATLILTATTIEARTGQAYSPTKMEFSQTLLKSLKIPKGFKIEVFAKDIGSPRMMVELPDKSIIVTRPSQNNVLRISESEKTYKAEVVWQDLEGVHGVFYHQDKIYLATPEKIYFSKIENNIKNLSKPEVLVSGLPTGGHEYRTLAVGPDKLLYTSIGSTCNVCEEDNSEYASIITTKLDGSDRKLFARGLRNTEAFDWHPTTGDMWGADNGVDWRGNNLPPEELNLIAKDNHYGWPYCWGDKKPDPYFKKSPNNLSQDKFCKTTIAPSLNFQAHAAPINLVFYNREMFPKDYINDAFVSFRGSWNRKPASGFKVVRVKFKNGKPVRQEDFVSGFLQDHGTKMFGRPAGLLVRRDGSLLISDDLNGVIYRVSH